MLAGRLEPLLAVSYCYSLGKQHVDVDVEARTLASDVVELVLLPARFDLTLVQF